MPLDEINSISLENGVANDRAAEFSGSRRLFTEVAHAFDVQLEDSEAEGWGDMLHLAYAIDQKVDIEQGDVPTFIQKLLASKYDTGPTISVQTRFLEYMQRQPESRHETIIHRLGSIGLLAKEQAAADTVNKVVDIRLAEADLFSYLLLLPTENKPDKTQREKFNRWLAGFSRTGYIVDSLIDIKEDYQSGNTNLQPSITARAKLAKAATKEALNGIRQTPLKVLGKTILVALKYEFRSRKPDFSET